MNAMRIQRRIAQARARLIVARQKRGRFEEAKDRARRVAVAGWCHCDTAATAVMAPLW